MHEIRCDFCKGLKYEASLVQEGVGDHQFGFGPYFVRENQDIEVDGTRPPGDFSLATERGLNLLADSQQPLGRQGCAKVRGGVDESRLIIGPADRLGFEEAGDLGDIDFLGRLESVERSGDVSFSASEV